MLNYQQPVFSKMNSLLLNDKTLKSFMYANKTLLEGFEKRPKFQAASNHYINTLKFNERHIDIVFH